MDKKRNKFIHLFRSEYSEMNINDITARSARAEKSTNFVG